MRPYYTYFYVPEKPGWRQGHGMILAEPKSGHEPIVGRAAGRLNARRIGSWNLDALYVI
jgi:hypothetical protein